MGANRTDADCGQADEASPQKHIPIRTCAGCGAKKPPGAMVRVASKDGAPPVLVTGKVVNGRSAYLCRDRKCLDKAVVRRALERSLKLKISTPQQVRDEIVRALESREG